MFKKTTQKSPFPFKLFNQSTVETPVAPPYHQPGHSLQIFFSTITRGQVLNLQFSISNVDSDSSKTQVSGPEKGHNGVYRLTEKLSSEKRFGSFTGDNKISHVLLDLLIFDEQGEDDTH